MIEELNITKPSDAVIKMVTNTYKEVEPPVNEEINQEKYMESLNSILVKTPIISNEPVTKKAQAISNLRKDISSGRVIRIPVNGGFIWKRIK